MAAPNPFALDKKKKLGGEKKDHKSTTYTEEEQKDLLHGYVEIPEEYWPHIKAGTHIRYRTKEGLFRVGGFIAKNPFDTTTTDSPSVKRFIKLRTSNWKSAAASDWMIAYEKTATIYVKPDITALIVQKALEKVTAAFNANLRKLADHAKALEKRLAALEGR